MKFAEPLKERLEMARTKNRAKKPRHSDYARIMLNPNVSEEVKKHAGYTRNTKIIVTGLAIAVVVFIVAVTTNMTLMGWQDRKTEQTCYEQGGHFAEIEGVSDNVTCIH